MQEITEYIEIFYNRQRKQARLGYLSPAAYTQRFYAKQLAAYPVGLHDCQLTSNSATLLPVDSGRQALAQ